MFDIGPAELLVIFVVALLVIGPERLPSAVKTTSLWIGRFRRSFNKIKTEVERELNADEIRRQLHNESILAEVDDAKKQAQEFSDDLRKAASQQSTDGESGESGNEGSSGSEPAANAANQSSGQPTTDAGNGSTTESVKNDLKQAVSYVNDISREVKASKQEIEEQFNKGDSTGNNQTGGKS